MGYLRGAMTAAQLHDEHFTIWSAARAEANLAYEAWCERRGAVSSFVLTVAQN